MEPWRWLGAPGRTGGSGERAANPRGMWFRRRRRGATQLDLSALDRLTELVDRIVALLPEQPAEREPEPPPAPTPDEAPPVPRPPAPAGEPGALLFVATASGYRLLDAGGPAPARGEVIELPDGRFRVNRVGPSPLPGDRRRCAFLDGEEPPAGARTSDG